MAFTKEDQIVMCGICEMPHHLSCWQENNGCTTFGCTGVIKELFGKKETAVLSEAKKTDAEKIGAVSTAFDNQAPCKADRFETLFHIIPNSIQSNSSIMIEEVSLIVDHNNNSLAVRCSFRCLTDKPIIAMMVDVLCSDIWGNNVQPVNGFQFLDLKTKQNTTFGQNTPIAITDGNTRSVDVRIKKILYSDKTQDDCGDVVAAFPTIQSLEDYFRDSEVAAQYARETNPKAKYVPADNGAYWMCSCGAINTGENSVCQYCKIEKSKYVDLLSDNDLALRAKAYTEEKAAKEERERLEKEERIRQAEERVKQEQEAKEAEIRAVEERVKKKKKKRRTIIIISVVIACLIGLGAVGFFYGLPLYKYHSAMDLLDNGQYDNAYAAFKELKGFKDSNEMLDECTYQKGCSFVKSGNWSSAINTLEPISYYKSSKDKINEAMYGYVCSHKNNDDTTTYLYLQTLKTTGYKDATSLYNELYAWSVTAVINSSTSDEKTDKSTISRYNSVYCHYSLHGGPPGESIVVSYTISFPSGSTDDGSSVYRMWDGATSWVGYEGSIYVSPGQYSPTGTMIFKFYDATGNYLGMDSVYIS